MSRHDKLVQRLQSSPKDFTWDELVTVMNAFGYEVRYNGGSSRKFVHQESGALLMMYEPHPQNVLKSYQIKNVLAHLKQERRV